ncbi:hypothetical protein BC832DRAFT_432809 [Gaertneriomyces semiglobifer]|nr:hypothetical protein BC832DRAFT_432809 [Gaertneriomyces semiglobifer]
MLFQNTHTLLHTFIYNFAAPPALTVLYASGGEDPKIDLSPPLFNLHHNTTPPYIFLILSLAFFLYISPLCLVSRAYCRSRLFFRGFGLEVYKVFILCFCGGGVVPLSVVLWWVGCRGTARECVLVCVCRILGFFAFEGVCVFGKRSLMVFLG